MRRLPLLALLVACAKREPVEAPTTALGKLQRRPHMLQEAAGCRRNQDSAGVSISAPLDLEAPIVVLDELHLHGRTPMSPRVAIWPDGDVIFAHGEGDDETLVTAHLPKERATAIARDVYELLDDVPIFTDVYAASGGTLMRINVKVDGKWRSAAVHGDETADFLAVAHGTAAPPKPKPEPPPGADVVFSSDFDADRAARPWPPLGFAKAFARLVELRLKAGAEFRAYSYDVLFMAQERYSEARQPALRWPSDLPRPPADLVPAGCKYLDRAEMDYEGGCRFVLDHSIRDAALRFLERMWKRGQPVGVIANGETFLVRFDWKYRGERTVEAISTCAAVLGHSSDAP